ncbi:FlgD immunoglobulin-like domain containing protein [Candidatus Zixiibacteriota bacterium]
MTFDFNIWSTEYGLPYIICHEEFDLHIVDTVGPLATGTYDVRTMWHMHYEDTLFDSLFGGTYTFERKFAVTGPLDIPETGDAGPPLTFTLNQNYPNPFNSGTTISFRLLEPADVELSIYDILGRRVRQLASAGYSAGEQAVFFDGNDNSGRPVPSGVYLYQAKAGRQSVIRRMALIK